MRNVRVIYAKKGRMKYVSHLDMTRYMTRLIRVSGVPAWYTEGFNQHIYMTFALPLSLGVTTDYDVVDMKITDDSYTDEMILKALQAHAAEGIEIISVEQPWMKVSELKFALYTLTYKDSDNSLLEALEKLLNGNYIPAEKKGKKNKITLLNLAEKIKSIETSRTDGILTVKVVLPAGNDETVNPALFMQSFTAAGNRRPEVCLINRDMLYNETLKKFE